MNVQKRIEDWYLENRRDLPWRRDRDPYQIWISETMLQQTTVTAVIPYYERFLEKFPTIYDLANAKIEDVLRLWAGLGYYSRARNLHEAAKILAKQKSFPRTYSELIKLPGFGPYTARAVSSLAFSEPVGVLDGNVIRVLTRLHSLRWQWWRPQMRSQLQRLVDQFIAPGPVNILNQALMELGSQVCTSKNPKCRQCPLAKDCLAQKNSLWGVLPLKKPRKAVEIWQWTAMIEMRDGQVRLTKNEAPFLHGHWLLPGLAKKLKRAPKNFDFRHRITHHDIYATVQQLARPDRQKSRSQKDKASRWVSIQDLDAASPYSLMRKAWMSQAKLNRISGKAPLRVVMFAWFITTILTALLLMFAGCQSIKVAPIAAKPSRPAEKVGTYTLLTQQGVNRTPRLSPNGNRLLYVSSKRRSHRNPQLYELNLKTGVENRLTFQDGEIFDGVFNRTGRRIIYSSSTDEIKENPVYLIEAIDQFNNGGEPLSPEEIQSDDLADPKNFWGAKLPPTDIYESMIDGSHLLRFTRTDSFDGEISDNPQSNEIAFVAYQNNRLVLYRMNLRTRRINKLSPIPSSIATVHSADEWPRFSPDGRKLVWVHEIGPKKTAIWIANADGSDSRRLIGGNAIYWTPTWLSKNNEILFSSNRSDPSIFELYVVKTDGSCLRQITRNSKLHKFFRMWQAEIDPKEEHIYFTSDVSGTDQIYKWTLSKRIQSIINHPCPPAASPTKAPTAAATAACTPPASCVPSKAK